MRDFTTARVCLHRAADSIHHAGVDETISKDSPNELQWLQESEYHLRQALAHCHDAKNALGLVVYSR